jgi:hypothetical protein
MLLRPSAWPASDGLAHLPFVVQAGGQTFCESKVFVSNKTSAVTPVYFVTTGQDRVHVVNFVDTEASIELD